MKKPIKFGIIGLILLASVAGGAYYMMMPIPVRMTQIVAQTAELSFTEQGVVTAESTVSVFSVAQGELNGLFVREGQEVREGDILLSVDDSAIRLQLEQAKSGIRSLEAQLANVDVENAALRQSLQTARSSLQGELQAINAQASESSRAVANHMEATGEQLRVQQILIDRYQSELNRVQENFRRIQTLYNSGVVTRTDFEAASSAITAAETQLEAAEGQLAVIAAGTPQNQAEHFEGIRTSLNAQIAGINQQLAQDTTTAARAHLEALIAIEQATVARLEREIANTMVAAPITGIVTALHAKNTNFISAAAPVAEITAAGRVTVNVYVSTQDIGSIWIGDSVGLTIRQRLEDIEFAGDIVGIDSTAVVRLTALGVEERKVNVRIEPRQPEREIGGQSVFEPGLDYNTEQRPMPEQPGFLGIGLAVDVTFYVFREENRIIVPRTAVFRDGGQYMVWAVRGSDSGTVEAVPVVTGLELRTDIIIESGLNEGDFVVNDANNADLRSGARVINERQ